MASSFCITANEKELISLAFQRYDLRFKNFENDDPFETTDFHDHDRSVLSKYTRECLRYGLFESEHNRRFTPKQEPLNLLKKLFGFDEYKDLMSISVKKRLKRMKRGERLPWVIDLLFEYHYRHECSSFVALAIKLSLRAFQLYSDSYSESLLMSHVGASHSLSYKLRDYLKMIQKYKGDGLLVATVMEVLCSTLERKQFFFKSVLDLKYVFESIQKTAARLPFHLNEKEHGIFNCFDLCLNFMLQKFVTLVTFGATSSYTKEDWDILKWRGIEYRENMLINEDPKMPVYGRRSLRLTQMARLFLKRQSDRHTSDEATFVLKLLWASIPEPYITEKDVTDYLREPIQVIFVFDRNCERHYNLYHTSKDYPDTPAANAMYRKTLNIDPIASNTKIHHVERTPQAATVIEAWQWFKEAVLGGDSPVSSPRSLQHLCRCAIRLHLAKNFLLPKSVHLLNIPDGIKNYLLLTDCGDNPYELEQTRCPGCNSNIRAS